MAEPTSSSLYSGQELRSRCIRLLDLSPISPREGEPLRGRLRVVPLSKNPTYEALSYTWGSDAAAPSRQIVCSGTTLPITRNCYDALCTLHRYFKVRTIWVDSLCINQDNDMEKGLQIPLMRDIYSKARRVFIWLGNSTKESDQALDWIMQTSDYESILIGARFASFPALMTPKEVLKLLRLIPLVVEKYRLKRQPRRPYSASAMQDLVSRDWFRRMWTMQELVMANEPLVVCGTKAVSWEDLHLGIARMISILGSRNNRVYIDTLNCTWTAHAFWVNYGQKYLGIYGNVRDWVQGDGFAAHTWLLVLEMLYSRDQLFGKVQDCLIIAIIAARFLMGERPLNSLWLLFPILFRIITRIITPQAPKTASGMLEPWEANVRAWLPEVMNMVRSREAKLPVDKVFALYSIFDEIGIPLQRPDYTKSVGMVYLEFMCEFIRWHKCLEMLKEASRPGIPGMPSWVPDWSKSYDRPFRGFSRAAGDSAPCFDIVSKGHNGTKILDDEKRSDIRWTPHKTRADPTNIPRIITKGVIVDGIKFCFQQLQESHQYEAIQDDIRLEPSPTLLQNTAILLHWLSLFQQPHFHAGPAVDTLSQSLFKFMHSEEVLLYLQDRPKLKLNCAEWSSLLLAHSPITIPPEPSAVKSCVEALISNEEIYQYHTERCNAISRTRIFFSTENNRLGTGPVDMQCGDAVALLAGFTNPIVLRRREGVEEFEVVGVAYIEGLMQGEAWPGNEADIVELTLV